MRQRVFGQIDETLVKHYAKVYGYVAELMKSNHGFIVKFFQVGTTQEEPPRFKRLYVCFEALKHAWQVGCRTIIGLDGEFLKGFAKVQLLTIVRRDGNNQMFPIAWAQVKGKTKETWTWFIEGFKEDLNLIQGHGLTVISNQQKGLVPSVHELLPLAEHRNCSRHIYANLRKDYKWAKIRKLFWRASFSSTPEEFLHVMSEFEELDLGAYNWLLKQNPNLWSRAFFSTITTCEAVENNMCEIFNGFLKDARRKYIIYMFEDIRIYLMSRLQQRRDELEKCSDQLCPKVREKLEKYKEEHKLWCCEFSGGSKFELRTTMDGYVVDLSEKTCSCRMWILIGIPYPHIVLAIYYTKDNPDRFVSEWLTVEACKRVYSHQIHPLNGENM